jgi:hypothetical protein
VPRQNASWTLTLSVLTSLATVGLTPRTISTAYFLPNLLAMHALLLLPLFPLPSRRSGLSHAHLYTCTAFIALCLRLPTYIALFAGRSISLQNLVAFIPQLFNDAHSTLFEHPAQTSIGFDVVFASGSFLAWMLVENSRLGNAKVEWMRFVGLVLATPIAGIAVTGSLYLAAREAGIEREEVKMRAATKVE